MSATPPVRGTRHFSRHPTVSWLKAKLSIARVRLRAAAHGARLAPGSLVRPDKHAYSCPGFLLEQAERHGPVFKALIGGKVTTCIFGLATGRRFLSENEGRICGATTDFTPLFPHGTLRQMIGDPHRHYRRIFVAAFRVTGLREHEEAVRAILRKAGAELASGPQPISLEAIRATFKRALTEILFRLILGIDRQWHGFGSMLTAYERYAPNGTFLAVRNEHHEIFAEMAGILHERARELGSAAPYPSLLGHLAKQRMLDPTSIGNLLQMTEAGRFDMMGLWCWLVRMLGHHAGIPDQIAEGDGQRRAFCEATVLEALRLEQSEFVLRRATSDIVFDGFFIPKRSLVRIAVWEAHKDPSCFADPFRFDPQRFLGRKVSTDAFAPFGLDMHRCLGADWVVEISTTFVEQMASNLRWRIVADAPPEHGVFHFQPSDRLSVHFQQRGGQGKANQDAWRATKSSTGP